MMRSKIIKIKTRVDLVLKKLGTDRNLTVDNDEIEICLYEIINITDECIMMLDDMERGLTDILRMVKK